MPDFPGSGQSCTGKKKNADFGTSPVLDEGSLVWLLNGLVLDWDVGWRNADAAYIALDADAQLWFMLLNNLNGRKSMGQVKLKDFANN